MDKIDIEQLILREAPGNTEHDKNYAAALRKALAAYKGKSRQELLKIQNIARSFYRENGNTHYAVASCIVLMELLKKITRSVT